MAKCQKFEWFVVLNSGGDIAKDENGLALMAKTKRALESAHEFDNILEDKTIIKVELSKITEI